LASQEDHWTYLHLRYGFKPISATGSRAKTSHRLFSENGNSKTLQFSILHNLFLLKILAIKKVIKTWFSAFCQRIYPKISSLKHLISFAFLINQQRIGATHFKIKHSDSCFSIASIYSDSFFAEFSWANEFLTTNKKAKQTWFSAFWQRIHFKEQISKIIDFIRFFEHWAKKIQRFIFSSNTSICVSKTLQFLLILFFALTKTAKRFQQFIFW
jgi:hypothetical protein